MGIETGAAAESLRGVHRELRQWLFDIALPLWWNVGGDREQGGFFEKISHDGRSVEAPRRTRVVGRQIYAYATAGRMGWPGPAAAAVEHGLDYLLTRCLKPDCTLHSQTAPDGAVIRAEFDLYDHAFALFGLAAAGGFRDDRERLAGIARQIREAMIDGWKHPQRGFEEAVPRRLPLLANPHMHILEACLAWIETGPAAGDDGWDRLADEIVELCLDRFLHPDSGALREFFDGDWMPVAGEDGRIVEPGHQYEWAWLLKRWGRLRGRDDALAAAGRLVEIAETWGVDAERGVAFNEIFDDFTPRDRDARIWPQTERIKAWLALADIAETFERRDIAWERAAIAGRGLQRYFADDVPGIWYETMQANGSFVQEHARASSLYHITCALFELDATVSRL
ncbi:AGE family epimerase/isomerase [uncultured Abyssibacter sp.]|uniref:AGE family epimerase/isomerase n=1 Tax=uncultured Abyssibacter sp. TaxID=2320202 RepID=UPI0032B2D114